ncbi:MAG TPA: adenylyltransferase/cytidyltransferase family protein [Thermomicrobiales bacterium]|nr:adenylyltransferase/cytidyltransferase family protein [Thermomicrobiales bacterium]
MGRVVSNEALLGLRAGWRCAGRLVVFTNGIFDLLHVGHLRYLREARALGDLLVVGLNDDASAARLKGPGRPLVPAAERAELLAALDAVDYVTLFHEDTPAALLAALEPDVYVKGGDYAAGPGAPGTPLPEAAVVRGYGGEVRTIPYTPGHSTTALIARARGGGARNEGPSR